MVAKKPHKVTVILPNIGHDTRGVRTTGSFKEGGINLACQITPETTAAIFKDYGIETRRPKLLICEVADARLPDGSDLFTVGARVMLGDIAHAVVAPAKFWECGTRADHASVILDEVQYAQGRPDNVG